jgi:hypothetical protein
MAAVAIEAGMGAGGVSSGGCGVGSFSTSPMVTCGGRAIALDAERPTPNVQLAPSVGGGLLWEGAPMVSAACSQAWRRRVRRQAFSARWGVSGEECRMTDDE